MTRAAGRVLLAAAGAALLVVTAFLRAQAPSPPSLGSTVGQWWKMLGGDLVGLAEAMPEDKFTFKPTSGEFKIVGKGQGTRDKGQGKREKEID